MSKTKYIPTEEHIRQPYRTLKVKFSHLNLFTDYSIIHGISKISSFFKEPEILEDIEAFCLTDVNNCFGAIDLSLTTKATEPFVKAVYGCSILLKGSAQPYYLYLLAKSPEGYKSLMQLISHGITSLPRIQNIPLYTLEDLPEMREVICITGGMRGGLGHSMLRDDSSCKNIFLEYCRIFTRENIVLDVHRIYPQDPCEEIYNRRACHYADIWNVPIVATNYVMFKKRSQYRAHLIKYHIQSKKQLYGSMHYPISPEQYFKTAKEMCALFHDMPAAIENTSYVVQQCNLTIPTDNLPVFPLAKLDKTLSIEQLGKQGLVNYLKGIPEEKHPIYFSRLEYELKVVIARGFEQYFLMVQDIVRWAKAQNIPVGPGRGSGGGSLLAFCVGIIELDPIMHGLFFDRFLNLERSSFVDFDIDFCIYKRAEVIEYIKRRYGKQNVSQIISYSKLAPRAALRALGRVFGLSFEKVSDITRHVSPKLFTTLDQALDLSPALRELKETSFMMEDIFALAASLEGNIMGTTRHAAGVLVLHEEVRNMGVFCCEGDAEHLVIQWDKDALENLGFIKMDILGLRTLTSMQQTYNLIEKAGLKPPELNCNQVLADSATFNLIGQGKTDGVFQMESRNMQKLALEAAPQNIADIAALIALYRPGPIESGMTQEYVMIKRDPYRSSDPLHPKLFDVLKETAGLIIYQEQIMHAAEILAGFSLGQGDSLQRTISKKKFKIVDQYWDAFLKGGLREGCTKEDLEKIFSVIRSFAKYGFNRAHATAYAVLTYRTAFLKSNYLNFFYLGLFAQKSLHLLKYLLSAMKDGITLLPPCVNHSNLEFSTKDSCTIYYGLSFISGLPASVQERIIEARKSGPFKDLDHFIFMTFGARGGISACTKLIDAGALDIFGETRSSLKAKLQASFKKAALRTKGIEKEVETSPAFLVDTPLELAKQEVKLLKVKLHAYMRRDALWLEKIGVTTRRSSSTLFSDRYYYVGILIDIIKLDTFNLLILQREQRGDTFTVKQLPTKKDAKTKKKEIINFKIGETLLVKTLRRISYDQAGSAYWVTPISIMTLEVAFQNLIVTQVVVVKTMGEAQHLLNVLQLMDNARPRDVLGNKLESQLPSTELEVRCMHQDKIIAKFRREHSNSVYTLHHQLRGKMELLYKYNTQDVTINKKHKD